MLNFRGEYIRKDSIGSVFNSSCNYGYEISLEGLQN